MIPAEMKQEILFRIDEIIEKNMVEKDGVMGADFSVVLEESITIGYSEYLVRMVLGLMERASIIKCGFVLIHRVTAEIDAPWYK